MLLKEIRENVVNKKGKTHSKLVCRTFIKEDSIVIAIDNRDLNGEVLIDITDLVEPYVDKETVDGIKKVCSSICETLKTKENINI